MRGTSLTTVIINPKSGKDNGNSSDHDTILTLDENRQNLFYPNEDLSSVRSVKVETTVDDATLQNLKIEEMMANQNDLVEKVIEDRENSTILLCGDEEKAKQDLIEGQRTNLGEKCLLNRIVQYLFQLSGDEDNDVASVKLSWCTIRDHGGPSTSAEGIVDLLHLALQDDTDNNHRGASGKQHNLRETKAFGIEPTNLLHVDVKSPSDVFRILRAVRHNNFAQKHRTIDPDFSKRLGTNRGSDRKPKPNLTSRNSLTHSLLTLTVEFLPKTRLLQTRRETRYSRLNILKLAKFEQGNAFWAKQIKSLMKFISEKRYVISDFNRCVSTKLLSNILRQHHWTSCIVCVSPLMRHAKSTSFALNFCQLLRLCTPLSSSNSESSVVPETSAMEISVRTDGDGDNSDYHHNEVKLTDNDDESLQKQSKIKKKHNQNLQEKNKGMFLVEERMKEWGIENVKAVKWFTAMFTALENSRKENHELRELLKRTEASIRATKSTSSSIPILSKDNHKLKSTIKQLQHKIADHEKHNAVIEGSIMKLKQNKEASDIRLNKAETALRKLKNSKANYIRKNKENERLIINLQQKLSSMEAHLRQKDADEEAALGAAEILANRFKESEDKFAEVLQEEHEIAESTQEALQNALEEKQNITLELESMKENYSKLQLENEKDKTALMESEERNKTLLDSLSAIQTEFEVLQKNGQTLESDNAILEERNRELITDIFDLKNEQAAIVDGKEEIEGKYLATIQKLEDDITKLQKELRETKAKTNYRKKKDKVAKPVPRSREIATNIPILQRIKEQALPQSGGTDMESAEVDQRTKFLRTPEAKKAAARAFARARLNQKKMRFGM
eukprot:g3903.t1